MVFISHGSTVQNIYCSSSRAPLWSYLCRTSPLYQMGKTAIWKKAIWIRERVRFVEQKKIKKNFLYKRKGENAISLLKRLDKLIARFRPRPWSVCPRTVSVQFNELKQRKWFICWIIHVAPNEIKVWNSWQKTLLWLNVVSEGLQAKATVQEDDSI